MKHIHHKLTQIPKHIPQRWQVCIACPALVSHSLERCPECGNAQLSQDAEVIALMREFMATHAVEGQLKMRLRYASGVEHSFVPRCVRDLRSGLKRGGSALIALASYLLAA